MNIDHLKLYICQKILKEMWEFAQQVYLCFVYSERAFNQVPLGCPVGRSVGEWGYLAHCLKLFSPCMVTA